MKTLLTFCLLALGQLSLAQTPGRTKIYLFNITFPGNNISVRTTLNRNTPIDVGFRSHALIETDSDSLNVLLERGAHPIAFDRGKSHYLIATSSYQSGYLVSEVSEREFWMSVAVNPQRKQKSYFLSKNGQTTEQ